MRYLKNGNLLENQSNNKNIICEIESLEDIFATFFLESQRSINLNNIRRAKVHI